MTITDTHMHIIPNVDDGSRSLEESVEMLRMSVAQGVGTIIATPHSWGIDNCGKAYMLAQYEKLKRAVEEQNNLVQLHLGCEMLVDEDTVDDCIRKLNDGRYPTLAGSRFVLTEFDPYETPNDMEYCIECIVAARYIPVIAHAERYRRIAISDINALKDIGAMVQINAYSIANEQNSQTRRLANDLLSNRMVDFIGSDAHRLGHRPPAIEDGAVAIIHFYSKEYAQKLMTSNPNAFFFEQQL